MTYFGSKSNNILLLLVLLENRYFKFIGIIYVYVHIYIHVYAYIHTCICLYAYITVYIFKKCYYMLGSVFENWRGGE